MPVVTRLCWPAKTDRHTKQRLALTGSVGVATADTCEQCCNALMRRNRAAAALARRDRIQAVRLPLKPLLPAAVACAGEGCLTHCTVSRLRLNPCWLQCRHAATRPVAAPVGAALGPSGCMPRTACARLLGSELGGPWPWHWGSGRPAGRQHAHTTMIRAHHDTIFLTVCFPNVCPTLSRLLLS